MVNYGNGIQFHHRGVNIRCLRFVRNASASFTRDQSMNECRRVNASLVQIKNTMELEMLSIELRKLVPEANRTQLAAWVNIFLQSKNLV